MSKFMSLPKFAVAAISGLVGLSSLVPSTMFAPQCASPPSTFTLLGIITRLGNTTGESYPIQIYDEQTGSIHNVYSTPYTGAWKASVSRFHYIDAQGVGSPCYSSQQRAYVDHDGTYMPTLEMAC